MNNLKKLRDIMREEKIDYYIITSSDFHQSEYVAEYFKGREFRSFFSRLLLGGYNRSLNREKFS
jgi:Xaa-Pro aminopeptidase